MQIVPKISSEILSVWYKKQLKLEEERKKGFLCIKVLSAKSLKIGSFSKTNPFIVIHLGRERRNTTVKNNETNPVWDETLIDLPCSFEGELLNLRLYDSSTFGKKLMEEIYINLDYLSIGEGKNIKQ